MSPTPWGRNSWRHRLAEQAWKLSGCDELGELPPERIIDIAERNGLINAIGDWVLRPACRRARQWLDRELKFGRITVNLSGQQIRGSDFDTHLSAIVNETGHPGPVSRGGRRGRDGDPDGPWPHRRFHPRSGIPDWTAVAVAVTDRLNSHLTYLSEATTAHRKARLCFFVILAFDS
ncbi:EAL domain-containing protein [Thiorhodovibrio frisius]